jgi:hypothetical protein
MNSQINELSKGEKASISPNKYNLWSKKKEGKFEIPDQPSMAKNPAKDTTNISEENRAQNSPPIAKDPVSKVREIMKPHSSFNFNHEIQNIRILVPF